MKKIKAGLYKSEDGFFTLEKLDADASFDLGVKLEKWLLTWRHKESGEETVRVTSFKTKKEALEFLRG